ncbi:MAG: type II toxin-antitoxin system VapC family toxin [Candidatus Nanohaloarchaea archaeon]|nr:type II toxin-antitoxin system VapC family toxin [Candidatus Nanohaloarchaea archaeon]
MIVDTDVLGDFLRGRGDAVELVEHHRKEERAATTDINAFELYFGAYKSGQSDRNVAGLKGLLNRMPVLSTSEDSMEVAGRMAAAQESAGERVGVKDVLIGSIAATESEPVLTWNTDEFDRLDEVETLETGI